MQVDFFSQMGMVGMSTAIFAGLVYMVLRLVEHPTRWYKTMFAFLGTGVVFAAVMLILGTLTVVVASIWMLLILLLGLWSLVVSGYVLAQAMSISFMTGLFSYIGLAIVLFLIQWSLLAWL